MSTAVTRPTTRPGPRHRPCHRHRTGLAGDISLGRRLKGFVALTKPRIVELLLVTTVPTMIVAARGLPPWWLMAATVVGGTLAAGGANALNMVVDRDIDAVMHRTRGRPLVTGIVSPAAALVFAIALEVVAFGELWAAVNLLSAVLAVSATLFYVFVYTIWLKRTSRQNIVIGGAAGAVPVLVGWAAVTGLARVGAGRAVRLDLRVDAPAFLGAGDPIPRRLPVGQGADDARRHRLQEHGRPDLRVLAAGGGRPRCCSRGLPGWGRIFWVSAVLLGVVFAPARPRVVAPAERDPGHAPLSMVDHLRDPPLRGHGGRPAHLSLSHLATWSSRPVGRRDRPAAARARGLRSIRRRRDNPPQAGCQPA